LELKASRLEYFSKFCVLIVLLFALFCFGIAFKDIPAVNSDWRSENVAGQWRIGSSSAMFNPAEHLFQVGQSFLSSGMVVGDDGTIDAENFSLETELENMAKAEAHLLESLHLRPGNAHAWTALAWVYSSSGDDAGMYSALEASWKTAPFNAQLSIDRLLMVEAIASFSDESSKADLLEKYAQNISNDFAVAERFSARKLKEVLEISEFLKEQNSVLMR